MSHELAPISEDQLIAEQIALMHAPLEEVERVHAGWLTKIARGAGVLALTAAGAVLPAETAQADSYLCGPSGSYSTCINAGYSDHGYGEQSDWSTHRYWGMDPRHNCTNYAAYMEGLNGVPTPGYSLGNAEDWGTNASAHGVTVDNIPMPGSIAWWGAGDHVAYVEATTADTITVSQDDAVYNQFSWKEIDDTSTDWPDGFIHFNDLLWKERNSNNAGSPDANFYYGTPRDNPMPGNWDGVGGDTPGITRTDGTQLKWYLRNFNSSGDPNITPFDYGNSTDIPVMGDWNNDGTKTIGIVRRDYAVGQLLWKLRNSNSAGSADYSFYYGSVTDIPVVGDWDSNGTTTIGIVRNDSGQWLWKQRNSNSSGSANTSFDYGPSSAYPVTGNWDGVGGDTIGVARDDSGNMEWQLRNYNSAGSNDIASFDYGSWSDIPVVGDWDSNGTTNIGIARGN